jgi:hypothetical protein
VTFSGLPARAPYALRRRSAHAKAMIVCQQSAVTLDGDTALLAQEMKGKLTSFTIRQSVRSGAAGRMRAKPFDPCADTKQPA